MTEPLFIEKNGHRVWLKWHRARKKASDPEFTPTRIAQAMRLGASVEVDLLVHAEGGFAILHDLVLDHATTGTGRVAEKTADELRSLQLRDNDGNAITEPVMLLEDLCSLLETGPAHPDALLQLDFKEDMSRLDDRTIAGFAKLVTPVARHMILSGGDADAVSALATHTPGLITGFDPTYPGVMDDLRTPADFADFIEVALAKAPLAKMIYLDYQLLLAADGHGVDMIAAVHKIGKRVDAWTIRSVTPSSLAACERLIEMKVDQLTTDDPELLSSTLAARVA